MAKSRQQFNHSMLSFLLLIIVCTFVKSALSENVSQVIIEGKDQFSMAPHGKGNVYAPEIIQYRNQFYLYYGAQGKDGHDRIQLATSDDGLSWKSRGVVFFVPGANHVNDPSVVVVDETLYMYYTLAMRDVTDAIGLATSTDGQHWKDKGITLTASKAPAWDSLLVGRPSVLYEKGLFRMWYDGRADLPIGSPDQTAPKSAKSHRFVGYAESKNGKNWIKHPNPIFSHDAGGLHVSKIKNKYIMLFESHQGTQWAKSANGLNWQHKGLFLKKDSKNSPHGHVTPFIFQKADRYELYFGAAHTSSWDNNSIMMKPVFEKKFHIY